MEPIVIGVAGGSSSGKTTIADRIKEEFKEDVVILRHDFYYKSNKGMKFEEKIKLNYDHPNAFDTDMLINHIKELKIGNQVERPEYSFSDYDREDFTVTVSPAKIILVEGILIFENEDLIDLMDIKIFVDTDADIRIIRRVLRDVKERKRDIDSVILQYCSTVKPMHEKFVEPSKRRADIIVPEGGHNLVAIDMILQKVRSI